MDEYLQVGLSLVVTGVVLMGFDLWHFIGRVAQV
jgi:hypothetical protein